MAEQNKTVTIAVIAVLAIAVIAVGSWLFLSDSGTAPTVVQPTTPAPTPAPDVDPADKAKPEAKPRPSGSGSGVKDPDDPVYDIPGRKPRADEMTPEERKRKRGDTSKPRGPMP